MLPCPNCGKFDLWGPLESSVDTVSSGENSTSEVQER